MRRHTIASLMAATLVIAVAVAALKNASDAWAGLLLLLTLALLGSAVVAIPYRRGGRRAFWFGFAVFGWGYLVLAQAPWFAEQVGPRLPTTQLLSYAHAKINPEPPPQSEVAQLFAWIAANNNPPGGSPPGALQWRARRLAAAGDVAIAQTTAMGRTFRFISVGSNLEQFQRVGQCLFALLAAVAGGLIARRFQRTEGLAEA